VTFITCVSRVVTALLSLFPLQEEDLKDAILLVFANKQDMPGALNAAQVRSRCFCVAGGGIVLHYMVSFLADIGCVGVVHHQIPPVVHPRNIGHERSRVI
jgi:hypothetical protein